MRSPVEGEDGRPGARREVVLSEGLLVRRFRFRARHHYGVPGWGDERNRRVFGDQVSPHEHDWVVEVHLRGPLDPETGFVADLGALDGAVATLLRGWDGGDLNTLIQEVVEGRMQPSTESLARWIFGHLERVDLGPARVERVFVFEGPDLGGGFPAR